MSIPLRTRPEQERRNTLHPAALGRRPQQGRRNALHLAAPCPGAAAAAEEYFSLTGKLHGQGSRGTRSHAAHASRAGVGHDMT